MNSHEELAKLIDTIFQRAVAGELRAVALISTDQAGNLSLISGGLASQSELYGQLVAIANGVMRNLMENMNK